MRARPRRLDPYGLRLAILATIVVLVHTKHQDRIAAEPSALSDVTLAQARAVLPEVARLGEERDGRRDAFDAAGGRLGTIVQTSPRGDHVVGFSGPTNVLVALDASERIVGAAILSSGDTRDHVDAVRKDPEYLRGFRGRTPDTVAEPVDAVTGATLTSVAIHEAIVARLAGPGGASLRFPEPLTIDDARGLFGDADAIHQDGRHPSLWHVRASDSENLGTILRTSPWADNVIGYRGPTETLIAFDPSGRVGGIAIRRSFDNDDYVAAVREDAHFESLFEGLDLEGLAGLDPVRDGIEGVSGATMTSQAVADALIAAARAHRRARDAARASSFPWRARDIGVAALVLVTLAIALTPLRRRRLLTLALQLAVIAYLGLGTGDMVSQALLFGWMQNGVPLRIAPGLVLLTATALVVPVAMRRNVYCTHLCPHGAAQRLLRRRLPWRWRPSPATSRRLRAIRWILVGACVVVAMTALPVSLVDLEPFDAWVFRVAGTAAISIAIVGLGLSMLTPMAYCRYGCPTGAVLDHLRRHGRSHRWSARDTFMVVLLLIAGGLWFA